LKAPHSVSGAGVYHRTYYTELMENNSSILVSIRLDSQAQRSLRALEASGLTRSEAIRKGLSIAADQLRRMDIVRQEAEMVASDQQDRQEMLEIANFMERLRAEG
jgi:hypothetical protein